MDLLWKKAMLQIDEWQEKKKPTNLLTPGYTSCDLFNLKISQVSSRLLLPYFPYGHAKINHHNYRSWYIKFVVHILDTASTLNLVLKGLIEKFDPLYCPRKYTVHPWLMWQDASAHKGWNLPLHIRLALYYQCIT